MAGSGVSPRPISLKNPSTLTAAESNDTSAGSVSNPGTAGHAASPLISTPLPTPVPINALPNELLVHIFKYLDNPQPSTAALYDEPHFKLTMSTNAPLQAISRVSKRWRQFSIPLLFKHAQFAGIRSEWHRITLDEQIRPFFDFVRSNDLHPVIMSFTLLILDKKVAKNWESYSRPSGFSRFWNALFSVIDPNDLLLVAPAEVLGALTGCHVDTQDAPKFDCPCHYLRLQKPQLDNHFVQKFTPRTTKLPESSAPHVDDVDGLTDITEPAWKSSMAKTSTLFSAHPWSSLLLNEGSFIRAYSMYEFLLTQVPSIMPHLVGADMYTSLITPTIREMSYIGIFPMSSHFRKLSENCPRLDRLYVQVVPRNDIMDNLSKMLQVEKQDLWMERHACYAAVMRQFFNQPLLGHYNFLQVFESGDADNNATRFITVEYLKRDTNGWKVTGDGVFERDPKTVATPHQDAGEGWAL